MRRLTFIILVFSLLPTIMFMQRLSIPLVKASPDIHQGDLVITGNDVHVIEDERFDINGSIIVEENATLILRNAVLNFTQVSDYQFNMAFSNPANGNPRLLTENATLISPYSFRIDFHGNSSGTVDRLECWPFTGGAGYLSTFNSSDVSISNSKVYTVEAQGDSFTRPHVTVFNSTTRYTIAWSNASVNLSQSNTQELWCLDSSVVNVSNSEISSKSLVNDSNVTMTNSTTQTLEMHLHSVAWLLNSTSSSYDIFNTSRAYVWWYLGVHVTDSESTDIPSANVEARYPNATVAESKLTDADGWTRLTLMEKMINTTGDTLIGNYTVTATFEAYEEQRSINMTDNQEITISLPFIIPEFPSLIIPSLFIIAILIIAYRRKRTRARSNSSGFTSPHRSNSADKPI